MNRQYIFIITACSEIRFEKPLCVTAWSNDIPVTHSILEFHTWQLVSKHLQYIVILPHFRINDCYIYILSEHSHIIYKCLHPMSSNKGIKYAFFLSCDPVRSIKHLPMMVCDNDTIRLEHFWQGRNGSRLACDKDTISAVPTINQTRITIPACDWSEQ